MKKVFSSHSDVCHVWAQQVQPEGRASNIFFEGASIYSYGYHYKMAKIHGSNGALVLINSRGYSSSTGKHTSHVRQAVSHLHSIDAPMVDPTTPADHAENVAHFLEIIENAQKKAVRARVHGDYYIRQAQQAGHDHNDYIDYFGINHGREAVPRVRIDALFTAEAREKIAQQVKAETERQKQRNKERKEKLKADFNAWKAGADVDAWQFRALPVALRLYKGNVQTSHGARCGLDDALLLVDVLLAGKDPAGFTFGSYTVTAWRGDALVIGCHKIPRAEVWRMVILLQAEAVRA